MCFYNDNYDWIAGVSEVIDGPALRSEKCIECSQPIAVGDTCRSVHQQEHEECLKCDELSDDVDYDEDGNFIPCDGNHYYGETFDCLICESCVQLLRAIESVEIDERCPPHARQPSIGGLYDEVIENDDMLARYLQRASEMFPGIEQRSKLYQQLVKACCDD